MQTAPSPNEVEISIFGPRYGECILIHVGDNDWVLVDSCIDPISKKPASIAYLKELKINPSDSIKLIVATHWHDDHIRGLYESIKECGKATFVFSGALRPKEFMTLIKAYGNRPMMNVETSGIQEFYDIISFLHNNKREKGLLDNQIKFAVSEKCLWRKNNEASALNCEVHSLAPSDASLLLSKVKIADLLPQEPSTKGRLVSQGPNHTAVVLWISISDISILLGSDLEETVDPDTGWSVIVESNTRPAGRASIFKIPHHGSKNAHNPIVWQDMLKEESISLLTPFVQGNVQLPTKQDIRRICTRCNKAYITAKPIIKRRKREKIVEQFVSGATRSIRPLFGSYGQVRLRSSIETGLHDWKIDLIGDATQLKSV